MTAENQQIALGSFVTDTLNGYCGRVIGLAVYEFSSSEALVDPLCTRDGKPGEPQWIKGSRLRLGEPRKVGL